MDKRNEKNRIITTLGKDKDSFYVYMLCENVNGINVPFYIGKGIDDRMWQHEEDAEKEIETEENNIRKNVESDRDINPEDREIRINELISEMKNEISKKHRKINELGKDNVVKVIVKWGLTEKEAFMAESSLINAYSLTNGRDSLTNVVNGHMSKKEKDNVACTTKARTVQDFLKECAIGEILVKELDTAGKGNRKVNVLFVKINTLYPYCKKADDIETAIYDSARGFWDVAQNNLKMIDYVFALYRSQVVGIYFVNRNDKLWRKRCELGKIEITPDRARDDKGFSLPVFTYEIKEREYYWHNKAVEANWDYNRLKDLLSEQELKEFKEQLGEKKKVGKKSVPRKEDDFKNYFDKIWKEKYCFVEEEEISEEFMMEYEKVKEEFLGKLICKDKTDDKVTYINGQNFEYNF